MADQHDGAAADMSAANHDGTDPGTPSADRDRDRRSDLEQAVASRSDAVARGEGSKDAEPGDFAGTGGTGGVVRNQDQDAQ